MNESNTSYLINKYPKLFKQYFDTAETTCMCWGFDCEDGWIRLIDELCEKLVKLNPMCEAVQVKQKWGGLRFYIDNSSKEAWELVSEYERKSFKVCEMCGEEGQLRKKGYWQVRCDDCEASKNET